MAKSRGARLRRNEEIMSVLRALHPSTFSKWNTFCSPLKIGIYQEILETYPNINKNKLNDALGAYTSTSRYLSALVLGVPRVDLSGKIVGSVSENEIKTAFGFGKAKFKKWDKSLSFEMIHRQRKDAA